MDVRVYQPWQDNIAAQVLALFIGKGLGKIAGLPKCGDAPVPYEDGSVLDDAPGLVHRDNRAVFEEHAPLLPRGE